MLFSYYSGIQMEFKAVTWSKNDPMFQKYEQCKVRKRFKSISSHYISSTAVYITSYLKTGSRIVIFSIWELDHDRGEFKWHTECFMNMQWQVKLLYMDKYEKWNERARK